MDRLIYVAGPVKISLTELNYDALASELDDVLPVLNDLLQSLQPVKMAVESLSASGNNLLASEVSTI